MKPITGANKLNSFQARSLANAAALDLLPWFPNWQSAPRDLPSEARRCDQNLALKALGPWSMAEASTLKTPEAEGRSKGLRGRTRPAVLEPVLHSTVLLPFCQNVTSQTRLPSCLWLRQPQRTQCCRGHTPLARNDSLSILPARGAQAAPTAHRQGCPFSIGTVARPRPVLTGHLQSGLIAGDARRGSDPVWGGRRGKMDREGIPELQDAELVAPAPAPHALARLPRLPALTPAAPGPAGAPASQFRKHPRVRRAFGSSGLRAWCRRDNGGAPGGGTGTAVARPWRQRLWQRRHQQRRRRRPPG